MYDEEVEQFSRCIVVVSLPGRYTNALRVDCPRVLRREVAIFSPSPPWALGSSARSAGTDHNFWRAGLSLLLNASIALLHVSVPRLLTCWSCLHRGAVSGGHEHLSSCAFDRRQHLLLVSDHRGRPSGLCEADCKPRFTR